MSIQFNFRLTKLKNHTNIQISYTFNNQNQNNLNGGDNYDLFSLYSFNKNNQMQGKYNVKRKFFI